MQNQSTMEKVNGNKTGTSQWGGLSLILLGGAVLSLERVECFVRELVGVVYFDACVGDVWHWLGDTSAWGKLAAFSFISRLFSWRWVWLPLVVAGMFLLNMNWSVWWPLMIVAPGLSLLVVAGRNSEIRRLPMPGWVFPLGKCHDAGFGRRFYGTHIGFYRLECDLVSFNGGACSSLSPR